MFKAATAGQKPVLEKYFNMPDNNAFVKQFDKNFLANISNQLFGSPYTFSIGNDGKSFHFTYDMQVVVEPNMIGGTTIKVLNK